LGQTEKKEKPTSEKAKGDKGEKGKKKAPKPSTGDAEAQFGKADLLAFFRGTT